MFTICIGEENIKTLPCLRNLEVNAVIMHCGTDTEEDIPLHQAYSNKLICKRQER